VRPIVSKLAYAERIVTLRQAIFPRASAGRRSSNTNYFDKWHFLWHTMTMKLRSHIDSAGRIVIPKELRLRYGLEKGRAVEIVPLPDGVSIVPELAERHFVRRGPLLTIDTGAGIASMNEFDVDRLRDRHLRSTLS
jgi:AbrB family looped-hinge helix DNA binding protein